MSGEEVLYQGADVRVTPARVVVRGTTYAVANITSIAAVKDTSMRTLGVFVLMLGIVLVVAQLIILGVTALLVGTLMVWFGKSAILVLTTGAAERRALRSRNETLVVDIASAINLAIMKRSALRG